MDAWAFHRKKGSQRAWAAPNSEFMEFCVTWTNATWKFGSFNPERTEAPSSFPSSAAFVPFPEWSQAKFLFGLHHATDALVRTLCRVLLPRPSDLLEQIYKRLHSPGLQHRLQRPILLKICPNSEERDDVSVTVGSAIRALSIHPKRIASIQN